MRNTQVWKACTIIGIGVPTFGALSWWAFGSADSSPLAGGLFALAALAAFVLPARTAVSALRAKPAAPERVLTGGPYRAADTSALDRPPSAESDVEGPSGQALPMKPSEADLETEAVHDLVRRMKRLRRGVALPTLIGAMLSSWLGMAAHALGYWSVLDTESGGHYVVSTITFLIAAIICAVPIFGPGVLLYIALRSGLRGAWREEHGRRGVDEEWLERNSTRFG